MADAGMEEPLVVEQEAAAAPSLIENVTQAAVNGSSSGKTPSTPEGMALAYGSLVVMALIPIFCGAFRSVKHQQQQKVRIDGWDMHLLKFIIHFYHILQ